MNIQYIKKITIQISLRLCATYLIFTHLTPPLLIGVTSHNTVNVHFTHYWLEENADHHRNTITMLYIFFITSYFTLCERVLTFGDTIIHVGRYYGRTTLKTRQHFHTLTLSRVSLHLAPFHSSLHQYSVQLHSVTNALFQHHIHDHYVHSFIHPRTI